MEAPSVATSFASKFLTLQSGTPPCWQYLDGAQAEPPPQPRLEESVTRGLMLSVSEVTSQGFWTGKLEEREFGALRSDIMLERLEDPSVTEALSTAGHWFRDDLPPGQIKSLIDRWTSSAFLDSSPSPRDTAEDPIMRALLLSLRAQGAGLQTKLGNGVVSRPLFIPSTGSPTRELTAFLKVMLCGGPVNVVGDSGQLYRDLRPVIEAECLLAYDSTHRRLMRGDEVAFLGGALRVVIYSNMTWFNYADGLVDPLDRRLQAEYCKAQGDFAGAEALAPHAAINGISQCSGYGISPLGTTVFTTGTPLHLMV